MLTLTRRRKERIMIGENISITIAEIKGNQVRVCISAPDDMAIHREEIFLKNQAEREGELMQELAQLLNAERNTISH